MVYADTACNEMVECFNTLGLNFSVDSVTESRANISVLVNENNTVLTWYEVQTGNYCFEMTNGSIKTYDNVISFREYLSQYLNLISVIIPDAKRIADNFAEIIGLNVVYDNFFGGTNQGYTVTFRVLSNSDVAIYVTGESNREYVAQFIRFNNDKSKYKVVTSYDYHCNDGGIRLLRNAKYIVDNIYKMYADSESVLLFNRTNGDYPSFKFTWTEDNICVYLNLLNNNDSFYYNVTAINSEKVELCIDELTLGSELYNLDALHSFILRYLESHSSAKADISPKESEVVKEDTEVGEMCVCVDNQDNGFCGDSVESGGSVAATGTGDSPTVDTCSHGAYKASEADSGSEESGGTDDGVMTVFNVVENGNVVAVRFVIGKSLYDIDVDIAKSFGLSCGMICDSVERIKYKGVRITAQERELRSFAENISDNMSKCEEIIDSFFR